MPAKPKARAKHAWVRREDPFFEQRLNEAASDESRTVDAYDVLAAPCVRRPDVRNERRDGSAPKAFGVYAPTIRTDGHREDEDSNGNEYDANNDESMKERQRAGPYGDRQDCYQPPRKIRSDRVEPYVDEDQDQQEPRDERSAKWT